MGIPERLAAFLKVFRSSSFIDTLNNLRIWYGCSVNRTTCQLLLVVVTWSPSALSLKSFYPLFKSLLAALPPTDMNHRFGGYPVNLLMAFIAQGFKV